MLDEELSKSLDYFRERVLNLDQSIPNALLLATSVAAVFVATRDTGNVLIVISLVLFTITLFFSLFSLFLLKRMATKAYVDFANVGKSLKKTAQNLRERGVSDEREVGEALKKTAESFDTSIIGIGNMRDQLNRLQVLSLVTFGVGIIFLILGLITTPGELVSFLQKIRIQPSPKP